MGAGGRHGKAGCLCGAPALRPDPLLNRRDRDEKESGHSFCFAPQKSHAEWAISGEEGSISKMDSAGRTGECARS